MPPAGLVPNEWGGEDLPTIVQPIRFENREVSDVAEHIEMCVTFRDSISLCKNTFNNG